MTPIHAFLERNLPGPLVLPALTVFYALLLILSFVGLGGTLDEIIYLDAGAGQ